MSDVTSPVAGHGEGLPALIEIIGEPRVRDDVLAKGLGYSRRRDIRAVIESNRDELECYGPLLRVGDLTKDATSGFTPRNRAELSEVDINPDVATSGFTRRSAAKSSEVDGVSTQGSAGRPADPYLLNEGQAVLVCLRSDAPNAAAFRREVIEVFMSWRKDRLAHQALVQESLNMLSDTVSTVQNRHFDLVDRLAMNERMMAHWEDENRRLRDGIANADKVAFAARHECTNLRSRIAMLEEAKRRPTPSNPHGRNATHAEKATAVRIFLADRVVSDLDRNVEVAVMVDTYVTWALELRAAVADPVEFVNIAAGLGFHTGRGRDGRLFFVALRLVTASDPTPTGPALKVVGDAA